MRRSLARRKAANAAMFGLSALCAAAAVSVLLFILGYLAWHGGSAINRDFFTQLPKPAGETGGGMANAVAGSAKLLFLAAVLGVPAGFGAGLYLAEFGGGMFSFAVRYTADLLNGVPSIVIGIFAYAVVVVPMRRFSVIAGALALAVMIVPVTARSTEQFLRAVPRSLREGALALGASRWRVIVTVVVPAALRGILTGIILSVARVAGESAPLLFTSFSNRYWNSAWDQPTASLPVMIFTYAISPYDDWHRQAWAAALVLLALMLLANVATRSILAPRGGRG
jgi:phosphate transport system permease protein